MSDTMQAVRFHAYGGPEVLSLETVSRPVPGADQVLVRVHAVGVNPVDWKVRDGSMKNIWPTPLPYTLGLDIAGTVEAIGAGVAGWQVGDAVYTLSFLQGGYAEYALVNAADLAHKPDSLSFTVAASVPAGALTAWQGLFTLGDLQPGQTVLINGAAGGVGMFAVQFAHEKGATVYGTASARNGEFVRSLGADHFVDYNAGPLSENIADKLDLVYDTVGPKTATQALAVLKPGGTLVCIAGAPSAEDATKAGVTVKQLNVAASADQLESIKKLFDTNVLRTYVSTVLPLAEARAAHEQSATGHGRGKIVLQVAS